MRNLGPYLRFTFGVVIVGILVNAASSYLDERHPAVLWISVQVSLLVAGIWTLVLIGRFAVAYLTSGRYAVLAMIINSRNELLLYRHPLHKVMLPPGGRVKRSEFPHEAIQRRLTERIGLQPAQYVFDEAFQLGSADYAGNLGDVQRLPAPCLVQREMHRQRNFVEFHYAFVYVVRIKDTWTIPESSKFGPMYFVDMPNLREMLNQGRTYADVVDAYKRVLETTSGATR